MNRKNMTRNALVTSIISLLLCVSLLVGTTFAWFTDSVQSGRNMISSGNLDIELLADGSKVDSSTMLFENIEGDLWEPGVVAYENFTVQNKGTLSLKYNMNLSVLDESKIEADGAVYKFSDAIKVGVVNNHVSGNRNEIVAAVTNWTTLTNFTLNKNNIAMTAGAEDHKFAIVLYWEPDVDYTDGNYDNIFNVAGGLNLEIGVNLYATQMGDESDAFDNTYDTNAKYSNDTNAKHSNSETTTAGADGSAFLRAAAAPANADEKQRTTVEAPAGAFDAADEVKIEVKAVNSLFQVTSAGAPVATLDVTMTVNGEENHDALDTGVYTVTTYISAGLAEVQVTYVGEGAQPTLVSYDSETGKLVFTTTHFSKYEVTGKAFGYIDDTAYATAEKAAAAVDNGVTVKIPEADIQEVAGLVTNTEKLAENYALASWNDNYYLTIAELKEAVNTNGAELMILRDITLTAPLSISSGRTITLDLNGHVLSGTCNAGQGYLIMVNNGAALNIEDSSSAKSGKIIYAQGSSSTGWAIDLEGKLNLHGGTIELTGDSWDIAYCVDVRPNAWGTNYTEDTVFTMNGGKLVSSFDAIRVASSSSDTYGNIVASFVMKGGEVDAARDGIFMQQSNGAYDTLKVEIEDGTVKGTRPIRVYGPNATSVNASIAKPMTITAKAASLDLVGALDTGYDWHTEGKIAFRGGMTLENLNQYADITLN